MFQLPIDTVKHADTNSADDTGMKTEEGDERWEGIPVVKIADDGDVELCRVLGALYDGK